MTTDKQRTSWDLRQMILWASSSIGLVIACGIAFWIWDAKNYPIPKVVDPTAKDPFGSSGTILQKSVGELRDSKEERFWQSFDLTASVWMATHQGNGTTSVVRFSESRVYVEPPILAIGIPFVHDTEYELLDDRIMQAVIPVPNEDGGARPQRKRASFEGRESDGHVYLQTTAADDFTMERID